jgi:hypothetical protein
MLGRLITYELRKKWKASRYVLLGYAAVQMLLLMIIRVFLWNEGIIDGFEINSETQANFNASFGLLTLLFFAISFMLGAYPFLESMYRFERDLSGKQAYLELMLPAAAWQKVLSKLAATLVSLVVCGTLSLLSMFIFLMVNSNFRYFFEFFDMVLQMVVSSPAGFIAAITLTLFGFACLYILIFLCIAVAKSFTHKNTIAVPIGIMAFILMTVLISTLESQTAKFPIYIFRFADLSFALSTAVMTIVLFALLLMATGWLMEKKIEH